MSAGGSNARQAAIAIRQVEKSTGASRVALAQAKLLNDLGFEVSLLVERGNADVVAEHGASVVKLWRWPFKGAFRRFWFNRRVQAWCRRHRPDVLLSHGDCETSDSLYLHNCVHLAEQYIRGRELPARHEVASIHDHVLGGGKFRQVVVNSRLMGNELTHRYGIEPTKIEVSYPGYDPQQFNEQRARADRTARRESLGVAEDEKLIGLVTSGNFAKRNVKGFVEMAAELQRRAPGRYRFLVVGKDKAAAYQQQAKEAGVAERMIWRSTMPDVETVFGALDLFVLPAHIEEFGLVVAEAMACATPVLVSDRVGASELLADAYPDLVMPHGATCAEWADRMGALLDQEDSSIGGELATYVQQYSYIAQREKLRQGLQRLTMNAL
ncbi:UDP-glucose:(heptosyl)LPS alpha-1,3-glucosyltransferase [Onishia taeanensis]|jgi:UDP-glucose:(heptosyl)LPS alpha-1,3-glucosyltransferase|uniref:UDP-glucose:(Heptosyl)LPS alpha-1,3-glucosyltransferase n=1 Tax=Onishia taeanensis TaxID=284577 RepID=A0A1G7Q6E2_9GAMM|nr:glycosyltransferase family 4 protein [Halomonas taeanensis]SDF93509.1 UDP-glucose:(heptosyl)LPS alpha-1,3-glucosyltransferase [Halomonas taeanensis]